MPKTNRELVKRMKEELSALREERSAADTRIKALENTLAAYNPSSKAPMSRRAGVGFDFRATAKEIFSASNNHPLRVREIIDLVVKKYPDVTRQQIKSKIVYAVRETANTLVKTVYGTYAFKDLPPYSK